MASTSLDANKQLLADYNQLIKFIQMVETGEFETALQIQPEITASTIDKYCTDFKTKGLEDIKGLLESALLNHATNVEQLKQFQEIIENDKIYTSFANDDEAAIDWINNFKLNIGTKMNELENSTADSVAAQTETQANDVVITEVTQEATAETPAAEAETPVAQEATAEAPAAEAETPVAQEAPAEVAPTPATTEEIDSFLTQFKSSSSNNLEELSKKIAEEAATPEQKQEGQELINKRRNDKYTPA